MDRCYTLLSAGVQKQKQEQGWPLCTPPFPKAGKGRAPRFVVGIESAKTWVGHPLLLSSSIGILLVRFLIRLFYSFSLAWASIVLHTKDAAENDAHGTSKVYRMRHALSDDMVSDIFKHAGPFAA